MYNSLVDRFTLHDAGFLLCNHAPLQRWNPKHGHDPDEVIRKKAGMTTDELERCAIKGFLEIVDENIERSELERWVTTKGIRPVFLFPDNEPEDVSDNLFSAYKHIDGFTLHDAGFLFCGHAPLPIWRSTQEADPHQAVRGSADAMARKLVSEARCGAIEVYGKDCKQIKFRKDGLSNEEYNNERRSKWSLSLKGFGLPDRWCVMRHDLVEWVAQKGQKPVFLFPEVETPSINLGNRNIDLNELEDTPDRTNATRCNHAWGKHTTTELEILKEAIQEFWENHDPKRPPKKNEVTAWLQNKGMTSRIAQAADTMMRTQEARRGGNKKHQIQKG